MEYVNWSAPVSGLVPPLLVTVTSTRPAASAGEKAVIDVGELAETPVAAVVPNMTALAGVVALNPVPVMVTEVPPAVGPEVGLTAVTVGAPMIQVSPM